MTVPNKSDFPSSSMMPAEMGEVGLENACILYLIRSSAADVDNFLNSLGRLKNFFLDIYPYPVIAFVEDDFLAEWKESIISLGVPVEFVVLHFTIPSHLPPETVPEKVFNCTLGYRHMCQFFTLGVYDHARLQSYKYYWRLDTYFLYPWPNPL